MHDGSYSSRTLGLLLATTPRPLIRGVHCGKLGTQLVGWGVDFILGSRCSARVINEVHAVVVLRRVGSLVDGRHPRVVLENDLVVVVGGRPLARGDTSPEPTAHA